MIVKKAEGEGREAFPQTAGELGSASQTAAGSSCQFPESPGMRGLCDLRLVCMNANNIETHPHEAPATRPFSELVFRVTGREGAMILSILIAEAQRSSLDYPGAMAGKRQ